MRARNETLRASQIVASGLTMQLRLDDSAPSGTVIDA
jgi:hypothetical protein